MSETGPDFGAAGNDSSSSPEQRRVTKSTVGRVSRRDFFKILGAGFVALATGGAVKLAIDSTPQQAPQENPLSEQYRKLMENSDVQAARKKVGGTIEDEKIFLYNYTTTDSYLAEGESSQWKGLIAHLEAEGSTAYYGQKLSLQKGGCLNQNNTVNVNTCELKHPAFKNLDAQTKEAYVAKFNSMAEQIK